MAQRLEVFSRRLYSPGQLSFSKRHQCTGCISIDDQACNDTLAPERACRNCLFLPRYQQNDLQILESLEAYRDGAVVKIVDGPLTAVIEENAVGVPAGEVCAVIASSTTSPVEPQPSF